MKKVVKIISILLVLVLATAMFAACKSDTTKPSNQDDSNKQVAASPSAEPSPTGGIDISKKVNLKMYLVGNRPKELDMVMEEVNKILLKDLNATLEINIISWGDRMTKFPLLFAGGEPYDICFMANWNFFGTEAPKGAFYPLNDLLPKYAPITWKEMPEVAWKQASYNGKIYMIPHDQKGYATHGVLVRGDLRKKYNVPEIKTIEDFAVYLDAVKKNEKEIIPLNEKEGTNTMALHHYQQDWGYYLTADQGEITYDIKKGDKAFIDCFTPEYENFVKMMRDWYVKGYWSKSVLSNQVRARDAFKNGTSASCIVNLSDANKLYVDLKDKHPEWDIEFYDLEGNTAVELTPYIANGLAISRSCQYPERAVMVIEKLRTDETCYDLTMYGIQGKHYVLTPERKIALPEGVTPDTNGYKHADMSTYGWVVDKFKKHDAKSWNRILEIEKKFSAIAITSALSGFAVNSENISAELAAVNSAVKQYKVPLDFGVIDPAEGLPILREQLKKAGIEKVLEEINKQISEFRARQ